jgi:hypothetical protein
MFCSGGLCLVLHDFIDVGREGRGGGLGRVNARGQAAGVELLDVGHAEQIVVGFVC